MPFSDRSIAVMPPRVRTPAYHEDNRIEAVARRELNAAEREDDKEAKILHAHAQHVLTYVHM